MKKYLLLVTMLTVGFVLDERAMAQTPPTIVNSDTYLAYNLFPDIVYYTASPGGLPTCPASDPEGRISTRSCRWVSGNQVTYVISFNNQILRQIANGTSNVTFCGAPQSAIVAGQDGPVLNVQYPACEVGDASIATGVRVSRSDGSAGPRCNFYFAKNSPTATAAQWTNAAIKVYSGCLNTDN